jgi:hypothetical protein
MQAEGASVLAGLRSGDGPLSVRVRPSSLKRDCGRRTTSTGERCLANVHAKSRLIPEPNGHMARPLLTTARASELWFQIAGPACRIHVFPEQGT